MVSGDNLALLSLLIHSEHPAMTRSTHRLDLFAATAFLHGAAVQEVSRRKLEKRDAAYPVIVAARAVAR